MLKWLSRRRMAASYRAAAARRHSSETLSEYHLKSITEFVEQLAVLLDAVHVADDSKMVLVIDAAIAVAVHDLEPLPAFEAGDAKARIEAAATAFRVAKASGLKPELVWGVYEILAPQKPRTFGLSILS